MIKSLVKLHHTSFKISTNLLLPSNQHTGFLRSFEIKYTGCANTNLQAIKGNLIPHSIILVRE